jgi:hypothetical protein
MISKGIPNEASDLPMVLMCVVSSVGEDYIGINAVFQCFEPDLDLLALLRKEAVSKGHDFDFATRGCR